MKVDVYDFDGTIYDGDSTVDFYFFCLKKNKKVLRNVPKLLKAVLLYLLGKMGMTKLKEVFFGFLKYIDNIDQMINDFWEQNEHKIKNFYLEKDHTNDIIISASPEFLLEPICTKLNAKKLIGSVVSKTTGKYTGKNCHDKEKVKRLFKVYKSADVDTMYTDSRSDWPLVEISREAYLVKKNRLFKIK